MRKVVLQEFVSIDGLAAGPNDTVDFIPASTRADSTFEREQSVLMDTVDSPTVRGNGPHGMHPRRYPPRTQEKITAERERDAGRRQFDS